MAKKKAQKKAAEAKDASAKYYQLNGTMMGYTGPSVPTLQSIEDNVFGDEETTAITPAPPPGFIVR